MPTTRIYYYCYDSQRPAGGEKECYQHVDILNRNGFEAYALHKTTGFRFTWFENTTRVAYTDKIDRDLDRDYLVVPENLGLSTRKLPGKKVIFNKGVFLGFNALGLSRDGPHVYLSDDVVAILSMSPHNREYLAFAYPRKPILIVRPDIRPDLFAFRSLSSKRLQIAYAAKASTHGRTLFQLLCGRSVCGMNTLEATQWKPIADLHERDVVAALGESLIFVFLSVDEGLPRLPLEAMACGCIVVAYDCGPLAEYLPLSYRFQYGDLLSIARSIERIVDAFPNGLGQFQDVAMESRRIAEQYSIDAQEEDVLRAWEYIVSHS